MNKGGNKHKRKMTHLKMVLYKVINLITVNREIKTILTSDEHENRFTTN